MIQEPPFVNSFIPDQTVLLSQFFTFMLAADTFLDPDEGDVLSYTATLANGDPLPSWLNFNAGNLTFSGVAPLAEEVLNVRVTATDTSEQVASDDFLLIVDNGPDVPIVTNPIPAQQVSQGQTFNYVVPGNTFTDPDVGDVLTYSASQITGEPLPEWLIFDPNSRTFNGVPGNDDVGRLQLLVTAVDTTGLSASTSFGLTILNVNDPPIVINPVPDLVATEDAPFTYQVPEDTFIDIDVGDTITYSARLEKNKLKKMVLNLSGLDII